MFTNCWYTGDRINWGLEHQTIWKWSSPQSRFWSRPSFEEDFWFKLNFNISPSQKLAKRQFPRHRTFICPTTIAKGCSNMRMKDCSFNDFTFQDWLCLEIEIGSSFQLGARDLCLKFFWNRTLQLRPIPKCQNRSWNPLETPWALINVVVVVFKINGDLVNKNRQTWGLHWKFFWKSA